MRLTAIAAIQLLAPAKYHKYNSFTRNIYLATSAT
jgi:hypothetical protein